MARRTRKSRKSSKMMTSQNLLSTSNCTADTIETSRPHCENSFNQPNNIPMDANSTGHIPEEHICVVCMGLIIPPVVLPCNHRVCEECFRRIEDLSNMECPFCRRRLHAWCRKLHDNVVDQELWQKMQQLYPQQCKTHTKDIGDDEEDELLGIRQPTLAKDGFSINKELRAEYEAEVAKIERLRQQEEELSLRTIHEMAQIEKDIDLQLHEKERLLQIQSDHELACRLHEEEKNALMNQHYNLVLDEMEDPSDINISAGGVIVDYHGCDFFPKRFFQLVIVLRTDTNILWERLERRGYSTGKIQENVQAEIMQVILEEARESYDIDIIKEFFCNVPEDADAIITFVEEWLRGYTAM
eukprot:gene2305-5290_t